MTPIHTLPFNTFNVYNSGHFNQHLVMALRVPVLPRGHFTSQHMLYCLSSRAYGHTASSDFPHFTILAPGGRKSYIKYILRNSTEREPSSIHRSRLGTFQRPLAIPSTACAAQVLGAPSILRFVDLLNHLFPAFSG